LALRAARRTHPCASRSWCWAFLALSPAVATQASELADASRDALEGVVVIGTSPVPGATIDADKVPANVETLRAPDLRRGGTASLAGALNDQLGSVNINDTLADPFQPDILYRGFEASPVLGTPQGLAVYQNGVRINEAFGDAVNWDLIPDVAISRVDIVSANPVYGLNALGGAAALTMKDGFNSPGGEAGVSGGSFRQRAGTAEFGANTGRFGVYAAGRLLDQDGWRLFARDRLQQFYGALSERSGSAELDLTYTHANNQLYGQGAAPLQSLVIDPRNVYTGPQGNSNRLEFLTLDGSLAIAPALSMQGTLYYRDYRQSVANGNTSEFGPCTTSAAAGLLCQADGSTPLSNASGQTLPDISMGGTVPIGENDFESIHSRGLGGSWQLHGTQRLAGSPNQFSAGVTVDIGHIDFSSGTQLGVIDTTLTVLPSNLLLDTPEGSTFSATPVILKASNKYYGWFATDTLDVTPSFALTFSGRFNVAQIDLYDQRGTNLDGRSRYAHFNPAAGATYKVSAQLTAYGGIAITNRAPTASEIECSDPLLPCLLPANLAGDPPTLKQVVARTYEAGLRGHVQAGSSPDTSLRWSIGAFRTELDNDIYAIANSLSTGFFQNVGATLRQGGQIAVSYRSARGLVYLNYSYVEASFGSGFALNSPSNPGRYADNTIHVESGDRLPGIPRQRVKAGFDWQLGPRWSTGATLVYVGSQFYKGDESNQAPALPGYAVLGLHAAYRPWRRAELFIAVQNLADRRYATFGIYGDPTGIGAPGIPADAQSNDPRVDNRFQSPGAPRSVFAGLRVTL
jgi:outer membrane receptor protein involved in Fe transport